MLDRNATFTVTYEQLEQLRNTLESTDVYFDSLLHHLPQLIRSYEVQYIKDNVTNPRHLRRLHLLGTLGENCREQIQTMVHLLQSIHSHR